jgi:hypothetical protein
VESNFFFFYQTILCVTAGEPYPQQRYQTGTTTSGITGFKKQVLSFD